MPLKASLSFSPTCNCLWPGPSRTKDESPVFSHASPGDSSKTSEQPPHTHTASLTVSHHLLPLSPEIRTPGEAVPHSAGTL